MSAPTDRFNSPMTGVKSPAMLSTPTPVVLPSASKPNSRLVASPWGNASFSSHQFDLARPPALSEERLQRAVKAEQRVPTLGRIGLNPVALVHAGRLRG